MAAPPVGQMSLGNGFASLPGHQGGERAVVDGRTQGADGAVGQDDVGGTGVEAVETESALVGAVDDARAAVRRFGPVEQGADEPVLAAEGVAPPGPLEPLVVRRDEFAGTVQGWSSRKF